MTSTFAVSSASTHYFRTASTLHFQAALFAKSDIIKQYRMQWPTPGTACIVVVSPSCMESGVMETPPVMRHVDENINNCVNGNHTS